MSENLKKHSTNTLGQATVVQSFSFFMPNGTQNWSMRFSFPGHGQIRQKKATALAHRKYCEAVHRPEADQSVRNKATEKPISDWLKLPRSGEPHQKISTRLFVMNRYFGGFIGNQLITDKTTAAYPLQLVAA